MSGLDYARRDNLQVSDGESNDPSDGSASDDDADSVDSDDFDSCTSASSSPETDVGDDQELERLRARARADHAELSRFVEQHRCPCEEAVMRWLLAAVAFAAEQGVDSPRWTLPGLLASMKWGTAAVSWFHYPSFRSLWRAPLRGPRGARRRQREVGIVLERRGGVPCMRLHYYMLNYAMCGEDFLKDARKPVAVYGYVNRIEWAWDGVGEWLA